MDLKGNRTLTFDENEFEALREFDTLLANLGVPGIKVRWFSTKFNPNNGIVTIERGRR